MLYLQLTCYFTDVVDVFKALAAVVQPPDCGSLYSTSTVALAGTPDHSTTIEVDVIVPNDTNCGVLLHNLH